MSPPVIVKLLVVQLTNVPLVNVPDVAVTVPVIAAFVHVSLPVLLFIDSLPLLEVNTLLLKLNSPSLALLANRLFTVKVLFLLACCQYELLEDGV
jgi:hypothetical protein